MKRQLGTRVDDELYARVLRVARADCNDPSGILRKCIVRYLPILEARVLGEANAGPVLEDETDQPKVTVVGGEQ